MRGWLHSRAHAIRFAWWNIGIPQARALAATGAAAALAFLAIACGSDSSNGAAVQQRIAQARKEGARQAHQAERLKQLSRQVHQLRRVHKTIVVPSGSGTDASGAATIPVTYVPYSPADPNYGYAALVPSGPGWSPPSETHPTSGELLRTTVTGPDGTLLIIDRTPSDVPTLGGGYDSVRTVSQPAFGSATEYLFSQSQSIPECNGAPCVDVLIDDGTGGGWGILAGGPSLPVAQSIGSQVAGSVSYGE